MTHRFSDDSDQLETSQLIEPNAEIALDRSQLKVLAGPDAGAIALASGAELAIGTAEGNDLLLTDATVSRHHAVLESRPDGVWLRDLGSTNGTRLAGCRITSACMCSGVSFTVGQTTLRFESLPSNIREPLSASERFGDVLGRSASIRRLFALLPRIAASDSTVLIEGETGTGKTLLASSIHEASGRAKEPFVVFDCGAVAPTLIESELFGHERGAFSGAIAAREGAFVAARRGTLFLDELGELPLELQPKLLRALSERTIVPLGSRVPREVDARVIAATNRDLRERVNQGHFRADLFYRVAVVRLAIPPLRERPDDIELLARHFYAECCPEAPEPPAEWLEVWKRLSWRGNVRELRSAVERIVLFGEEQPSEAQAAPKDTLSFRAAKERVIESFEREYLQRLLARAAGNVSKAARIARMDRNHLRELLRRHGLEPHR